MSTWISHSDIGLYVDDEADASRVIEEILGMLGRDLEEYEHISAVPAGSGDVEIDVEVYVNEEAWPEGPAGTYLTDDVAGIVGACAPGSSIVFYDNDDQLFWKCQKSGAGEVYWRHADPVPGGWNC